MYWNKLFIFDNLYFPLENVNIEIWARKLLFGNFCWVVYFLHIKIDKITSFLYWIQLRTSHKCTSTHHHLLSPEQHLLSVLDLPMPEPWARLKFRPPSVKIKKCDACKPYGVGSRDPFKGPGGVQGLQEAEPPRAVGFCGILSAKLLSNIVPHYNIFILPWFQAPWI